MKNKTTHISTDRGFRMWCSGFMSAMVVLLLTLISIQTAQAQTVLVPFNQNWKYNPNNIDLLTAWRDLAYDDSGWSNGVGPLGFPIGEALTGGAIGNSGLSIQTVLPQFSPVDASRVRTYYFRVKFVITNDPSSFTLLSSNLIDDAAVLYINGIEIGRPGFNAGTVVTHASEGNRAAADVTGYGWDVITNFPPTALVLGTNILAVEVHQTGASSSDLVFANNLVALIPTPVAFTIQPTNQTVPENRVVNLVSSASGFPAPTYQWYRNTNAPVQVPDATNATYTITNTAVTDTDDYFVVAMNSLNTVTSLVARLRVVSDTNGPVLIGINTDDSFQRIILKWDELIAQGPAIESGNYDIRDSQNNQIIATSIDYNGTNVVLHVPTLARNTNYTIEIDFQQDLVGNLTLPVGNPQLDPANGVATNFHTWTITRGFTRFQAYLGLPAGQNIGQFVSMPIYPDGSTFSFYTNNVYWPQTAPNVDQYAMRFTGLYVASESGTHHFNPAHDDDVRLRVYASESPADTFTELAAACCTDLVAGPTVDVDLVAGNMYYYELIVREFGGGDYAGFSVTLPSSAVVSPANGAYLAIAADPVAAPNFGISSQPQNQTVAENHSATFSVAVTNAGSSVAYQWQVQPSAGGGFTDIPGALGSSYTTPLLTLANNGDQYRVIVSVPGRTLVSGAATANVIVDTVKPLALSARGNRNLNSVIVRFNEAMASGPAINPANYTVVSTNGTPLTVGAPTLGADLMTVTIPTSGQVAGEYYVVTIQNVTDVAGNVIVTTNLTFQTWLLSPGFVLFEAYNTGGGNAVSDLTGNVNYPNNPDLVTYLPTFDSRNAYPTDSREGYGARISGYFIAPATSNYIFYLRSDDASEFWMNTNAVNSTDPAGKSKLQEETGCCNTFGVHPTTNPPPSLVGGQAYYLELLYKEGTGGDFGQAAFKAVGDPRNPDTLTPIPGAYLATLADPVGASVTITQQPQNATFVISAGATALATETFNANDGGYTVSNPTGAFEGPWTYNVARGSWQESGQNVDNMHPNTSLLDSTTYTVTTVGNVLLNLTHRWSFEHDGTAWDGGQIRVSRNGGPFTALPASAFVQNGYNGSVAGGSTSQLAGQGAFIAESTGYASSYVVSVANLGLFNPGDTIRIEFFAGSDSNTRGQVPNWEIDQIVLTQGNTEPSVTFSVGSTAVTSTSTNPPRAYQWYRNNGGGWVAIAGANASTYSFVPVQADNGAQFRVVVYVPGASATSATATLTVTSGGGNQPTLRVTRNGNQITVTWSGGGTLQEATDLLSGGATVWTNVPGSPAGTYTTTTTGPRKFYRVRVP